MEILRFAFTYAVAAKLAPIKKTKSMTWKFAKYLGEEIESFLPHFEGTCEKTFNDVTHLSARRPLDGAGPLAEHGVGDDDGRGDLSDERERGLAESLAVAGRSRPTPAQPSLLVPWTVVRAVKCQPVRGLDRIRTSERYQTTDS